jgi:hypothetical protein
MMDSHKLHSMPYFPALRAHDFEFAAMLCRAAPAIELIA